MGFRFWWFVWVVVVMNGMMVGVGGSTGSAMASVMRPEMGFAMWSFVMRLGSMLMLDGYPFYANGWNSYWLMVAGSEESTRPRVDEILRDGAALGLTVCRTWAFNDGSYQALQMSPGSYDEQVFQALDYVIYQAEQNGVRLLLTLVNNWEDYGGKAQYVTWAKAEGENVEDADDFFTNSKCREYYKNHVKAVLTRVNTITQMEYRDDPTIFGWELINEPQCTSDPSGEKLKAWVGEMAMYVKSLDRKHLLTVGTEGFYASDSEGRSSSNPSGYFGTVGTDFIRDHDSPWIDFATAHAYPDAWLSPDTSVDEKLEFFHNWVEAHTEDAQKLLRMPLLFTEFGLSDKKPGFSEDKRDAFYSVVYDQVYQSAQNNQGALAGAFQWQLLPPEMSHWDDGYAIIPTSSSSTCNIISLQSQRLNSLYKPVCGIAMGSYMLEGVYENMTSPHRHIIPNLFEEGFNYIN
ncbi:hypothetical protein M758_4G158400 [Ceratodon purpureus]|nr:hypothetical protein M758_4G158400 [Ceratodon purpureus]